VDVLGKPIITTRECKCKQDIIFKLVILIFNFNYILDAYVETIKPHIYEPRHKVGK